MGLRVGASAQDGVSTPFMAVELNMAPFQGADASQTRKRAEAFLAATGYKVLSYQDNEAVRAVDVTLPRRPEGVLENIRYGFEKMKVLRALRSQSNVSEVVEFTGGLVAAHFEPFVYRPQAEKLRAVLPAGAKLSYCLNPAMKGLWVNLDVSGFKDAGGAAREFARQHPDQVASADIRVKVEVMRAETR